MVGQGDGPVGMILKLGPQHPCKFLIYASVIQCRVEGMDRQIPEASCSSRLAESVSARLDEKSCSKK